MSYKDWKQHKLRGCFIRPQGIFTASRHISISIYNIIFNNRKYNWSLLTKSPIPIFSSYPCSWQKKDYLRLSHPLANVSEICASILHGLAPQRWCFLISKQPVFCRYFLKPDSARIMVWHRINAPWSFTHKAAN